MSKAGGRITPRNNNLWGKRPIKKAGKNKRDDVGRDEMDSNNEEGRILIEAHISVLRGVRRGY